MLNLSKIVFKLHHFRSVGRLSFIGKRITVVNPEYISINDGFEIGDGCILQTWPVNDDAVSKKPELTIGKNVSLMRNCQISCLNRVMIGDGCLLGDNVFITDNFHGMSSKDELCIPPLKRNLYSKGEVVIGNNVWVGRNVCIMPGVKIGDGAVIGANAVVTCDVESKSVVAGVPAKRIH